MKIFIEDHNGHSISYDDDLDKFVCDIEINSEVKNSKRQSLKAVRKDIDDFIKLNLNFKPFKAFRKDFMGELCAGNFVSVRSDNMLVFKSDNSSNKDLVGPKDFSKYFKYNEDFEKELKAARATFDEAVEVFRTKKKELSSKLEPIDLTKYAIR